MLKSSHCNMKAQEFDWKRFRHLLNKVIPFQKETLQDYTNHLFVFFVRLCGYQILTNQFCFYAESPKTSTFEKLCCSDNYCSHLRNFHKKLHMSFQKCQLDTESKSSSFIKFLEWLTKNCINTSKQKNGLFTYFKSFWRTFYVQKM